MYEFKSLAGYINTFESSKYTTKLKSKDTSISFASKSQRRNIGDRIKTHPWSKLRRRKETAIHQIERYRPTDQTVSTDTQSKIAYAADATAKAHNQIEVFQRLLKDAVTRRRPLDWESLQCTPYRYPTLDLDTIRRRYSDGNVDATKTYFALILGQSVYPDGFPSDLQLTLDPNTMALRIDFRLPSPNQVPTVLAVVYDSSNDIYRHVRGSKDWRHHQFEKCIAQITLRTMYEVFLADIDKVISTLDFRGYIDTAMPPARKAREYIAVKSTTSQFSLLDLQRCDPIETIQSLRRQSGSIASPNALAPRGVPHIVSKHRDTSQDQSTINIAAIHWQDFEFLVRNVFEREFHPYGGNVTLTKASCDGGIDVLAFDPDPIRGGKIAIQAKRYRKAVPVSAVRDLYGTIMNEGATKGILITTATFGPASYAFAADKPITLMNGSDFLALMTKHGFRGCIDIDNVERWRKSGTFRQASSKSSMN